MINVDSSDAKYYTVCPLHEFRLCESKKKKYIYARNQMRKPASRTKELIGTMTREGLEFGIAEEQTVEYLRSCEG